MWDCSRPRRSSPRPSAPDPPGRGPRYQPLETDHDGGAVADPSAGAINLRPVRRHQVSLISEVSGWCPGSARLEPTQTGVHSHNVVATLADGTTETYSGEVILIATGASPRILPTLSPMASGSSPGVSCTTSMSYPSISRHRLGCDRRRTVHAYTELGVKVTLVSSRDRVLPHDEDARTGLRRRSAERGVDLINMARADNRLSTKVIRSHNLYLADGQQVVGSRMLG